MHLPFPMPIPAAAFLSVAALGTVYGDNYEETRQLRGRRGVLPLEELLSRSGPGPDLHILEIESEFEYGCSVYEVEDVDGDCCVGVSGKSLRCAQTSEDSAPEESTACARMFPLRFNPSCGS